MTAPTTLSVRTASAPRNAPGRAIARVSRLIGPMHCYELIDGIGADCMTDDDCSDDLVCKEGKCAQECSWKGHCEGRG